MWLLYNFDIVKTLNNIILVEILNILDIIVLNVIKENYKN